MTIKLPYISLQEHPILNILLLSLMAGFSLAQIIQLMMLHTTVHLYSYKVYCKLSAVHVWSMKKQPCARKSSGRKLNRRVLCKLKLGICRGNLCPIIKFILLFPHKSLSRKLKIFRTKSIFCELCSGLALDFGHGLALDSV